MTKVERSKAAAASPCVELIDPPPASARAGQALLLRVRVLNADGMDLVGAKVQAVVGEFVAHAVVTTPVDPDHLPPDLRTSDPDVPCAALRLAAPAAIGVQSVELVFPPQDCKGVLYEEARLEFRFDVTPQTTSMAIWDMPAPVSVGQPFTFKVGVTSSDGLALAGARISVMRDGEVLAEAALGDAPWGDTTALYWTEVVAPASQDAGVIHLQVSMDGAELPVPYQGCSDSVMCRLMMPPDTLIEFVVIDCKRQAVENAEVTAGLYRSFTDANGVARIEVARGRIDVAVVKDKYAYWTGEYEVAGHMQAIIELESETEDEEPMWV
ncbi:MAG: hypothetical protein ACK4MV_03960 [Beijerinckiaceae bacterium]